MTRDEILAEIKRRLTEAYGDRLHGLILYGSEARGEPGPDSDYDVLALLDGPINGWEDIGTGVDATYDLAVELGRPIHPIPAPVDDFERGRYPFYGNVRKEGIVL